MDPLNEDVLLAMEDMGLDKERTLQVYLNEQRGVAVLLCPIFSMYSSSWELGSFCFPPILPLPLENKALYSPTITFKRVLVMDVLFHQGFLLFSPFLLVVVKIRCL